MQIREKKNPLVFYKDSALMETFWKKGGSNIAETISSILIFFSVSVGGIPFKWDIIS